MIVHIPVLLRIICITVLYSADYIFLSSETNELILGYSEHTVLSLDVWGPLDKGIIRFFV